MTPLVSVVIPVFNGMPHLKDLIESLQAQTYTNLEIILSEGGSNDSSLAYLNGLSDSRFRVIQQPVGTSAAENWTKVTQEAQGQFIKLVCQDDLLKPDAIEKQLKDLLEHPSAVMAIAQRDIVDAQGKVLYAKRGCQNLDQGIVTGDNLLRIAYLQGTNIAGEPLAVLFRSEHLLKALPWDDSNPLVLDLAMYEKVAPGFDVVVRKESIGAFRVSTSSWSTRLAKQQLVHFEQWQQGFASRAQPQFTTKEVKKAARSVRMQTRLRRGAYLVLRLKGSFKSAA